jgi:hypothetical protein
MSIFNQIQTAKPRSNTFNLSHDRKMSMQMGTLTPTLCMDVLPGDKIMLNSTQMLRFAPMIAPVMHRIDVYQHFFFVPNRLLWDKWEDFITGGEDGLDNSVFPTLYANKENTKAGTLLDYLGIPALQNPSTNLDISALPVAGYNKIYNEYYRDQNLITKLDDTLNSGHNMLDPILKYRSWQHDYFTSALPWTQKGEEATIPLLGEADISFQPYVEPQLGHDLIKNYDGSVPSGAFGSSFYNVYHETNDPTNPNISSTLKTGQSTTASTKRTIDNSPWLKADLSSANSTSINDLRQAFRLQEFLEKNARGGSRYIEVIKSHFGVTSSDARLQRPEYLGGGKSPVTISEVLQTSDPVNNNSTPQGNMAGHGINVGGGNRFSYRAQEHGYIIGIMSIMPKTAYFQGTPKHFTKFDKFDYYFPSFAHLGEQPITTGEIFTTMTVKDDVVFGYTPRYAEYKHHLSSVHGEFRDTLKYWHMARDFQTQPYLNEEFINADINAGGLDRIFAVQGTEENESEQIYAHIFHDLKAKRLMPYFGTPKGV